MLTSYAQNFEDVMLWRALQHVGKGCYVDIGAQDPVVDSVSLGFYEQGWRGVHVEPSPHYAQRLREARPDETVLQAFVGASTGLVTLHEIPGTGLSTGDAAVAAKHGRAGFEVRGISVPSVTLDDVFDRLDAREVHWLKIDVEGGEKGVLEGWNRNPLRPWIVVIESTLPNSRVSSHRRWEKLLLDKGYVFTYFDGLNRFYVSKERPELAKAFSSGPNLFDDFALSGLATSPFSARLHDRLQSIEKTLADARGARETAEIRVAALVDEIRQIQSIVDSERNTTDELTTRLQRREQEHAERLLAAQTESNQLVLKALEASAASQRQLGEVIERAAVRDRESAERLSTVSAELARLSAESTTIEADLRAKLSVAEQEGAEAFLRHGIRERELEQLLESVQTELLRHTKAAVEQKHALDAQAEALRVELTAVKEALATATEDLVAVKRELAAAKEGLATAKQELATAVQERRTAELRIEIEDFRAWLTQGLSMIERHGGRWLVAGPSDTPAVVLSPTELLRLEDREFIVAAYRTLLRRDPDPDGLENYLGLLRSGINKMEIILQIRFSGEGRVVRANLAGLRMRVAAAAVCRLPVLRSFVNGVAALSSALAVKSKAVDVGALRKAHEALKSDMTGIVEMAGQLRVGVGGALQETPTWVEAAKPDRSESSPAPATVGGAGLAQRLFEASGRWPLGRRVNG